MGELMLQNSKAVSQMLAFMASVSIHRSRFQVAQALGRWDSSY